MSLLSWLDRKEAGTWEYQAVCVCVCVYSLYLTKLSILWNVVWKICHRNLDVIHVRALINKSYNKTIKYTNVKIIFLHTICHNYVSIYLEHPVTEHQYSIHKDIDVFSNTLKFVYKMCADIIKFVCTSSTLLQKHFIIYAQMLMYLIIHFYICFIYVK